MLFHFDNHVQGTKPFIANTVEYIRNLLKDKCTETFIDRCRNIISEFCINSIKHSGSPDSGFDIYMEGGSLLIEKIDNGHPFAMYLPGREISMPLANDFDIITLMEDDINKLQMQRLHDYGMRFFAEDSTPSATRDKQTLQEHFGLIIISRSADNFTYHYNTLEQSNTFTALLRL